MFDMNEVKEVLIKNFFSLPPHPIGGKSSTSSALLPVFMSTWRLVRSTPAEYKERTRADAQFYSGGWSTRTRRLLTASSENRGAALLLMMIARHTYIRGEKEPVGIKGRYGIRCFKFVIGNEKRWSKIVLLFWTVKRIRRFVPLLRSANFTHCTM